MSFQLHPLAFGVMLVVAVGTFAYTWWNSRSERNNYNSHRGGNTSRDYYPDFDFDDCSSTTSTVDDESRQPKKKRNSDRCSICLGSMKNSLKTLTCSHIFHEHCITSWLVNKNTCPICRNVTS